jgi:hypothetical protein
MNSIQRLGNQINTRYLILGVAFWWLVMLIVYSAITLRIHHRKNELRASGVAIANEFSKLVSLPLLENNSRSIHKLLTEAANKADVIYASVVDHRNKVVAFTGTGHLMPDVTEGASSIDKVSIWEGGFASHARILNFVSEITYSGTKIGEFFIGLSTPASFQTHRQFAIIAVSSCLAVLLLVILFRYPSIKTFVQKYAIRSDTGLDPNATRSGDNDRTLSGGLGFCGQKRQKTGARSALSVAGETGCKAPGLENPITCPLCGAQNAPSETFFSRSNLDKFLAAGDVQRVVRDGDDAAGEKSNPHKPAKTEDFSWIRRQIILRCTEIIKKLTV